MTEEEFRGVKVGDKVKIKDIEYLSSYHGLSCEDVDGNILPRLQIGTPPWVRMGDMWNPDGSGKEFVVIWKGGYASNVFRIGMREGGYDWGFHRIDFDVVDPSDSAFIPDEEYEALF